MASTQPPPVPEPPVPEPSFIRTPTEGLIDALTAALPRTQRLKVMAKQQLEDATAALTAMENAIALLGKLLREQRKREAATARLAEKKPEFRR